MGWLFGNKSDHQEALERARLILSRYRVTQWGTADAPYYDMKLPDDVEIEFRWPMEQAITQIAKQVFETVLPQELGNREHVKVLTESLSYIALVETKSVPLDWRRTLRQRFYEASFDAMVGMLDSRYPGLDGIDKTIDGCEIAVGWYDDGEIPARAPLKPQPTAARSLLRKSRELFRQRLTEEERRLIKERTQPPMRGFVLGARLLKDEMPNATDEEREAEAHRRQLAFRDETLRRLLKKHRMNSSL